MAEAKLVSKLTMDSSEFDRTTSAVNGQLDKLKGKARSTSGNVQGLGGSLQRITGSASGLAGGLSSLVKGAGALGAGFLGLQGGLQVLNGIIQSTQGSGDAFAVMMAGAKGAVDHFFQSIANGDWSGLINGFASAIEYAEEYARWLDAAGDSTQALGVAQAKTSATITQAKAIIDDPNSTQEQIDQAKVEIEKAERELREINQVHIQNKRAEALSAFHSAVGHIEGFDTGKLGEDDIWKYLTVHGIGRSKEFNEYNDRYNELKKRSEELEVITAHTPYGTRQGSVKSPKAKQAQKELEAFIKANPVLDVIRQINNNITDEEREAITKPLRELNQAMEFEASQRVKAIKASKKADKITKPEEVFSAGSIGKAEKDLQRLQKSLKQATTEPVRQQLRREIAELEELIYYLQTGGKHKRVRDREKQLIKQAFPYADGGSDYLARTPEVKLRLPKHTLPTTEGGLKGLGTLREAVSRQRAKAAREEAEANDLLATSISGVGNALQGLSGITDDNTAKMLQWMATVLQSVGQALPAILSLTAAQKTQAVAGAAASSSVLGPISVAASIASVVAAIASIPKFAEGGIVGGTSYYGDKILARVNSGELIANKPQQRRIWQEMQAARGATLSTAVEVGGEFRLRGEDLLVSLERASRRKSR